MKSLGSLIIFLMALQLALAVPVPITNRTSPSLAQRRYDFFDFISNFTITITRNHILQDIEKMNLLLEDYNNWWSAHKGNEQNDTKTYEQIKNELEWLVQNHENVEKDPTNCELFRKYQNLTFEVTFKRLQVNNVELNEIWKKHQNNTKPKNDDAMDEASASKFFDELKNVVEEFLVNLTEEEKNSEENKLLVKWCQSFLKATNLKGQEEAFGDITELYAEEYEMELKANNVNCKLLSSIEFLGQIIALAMYGFFNALFSS